MAYHGEWSSLGDVAATLTQAGATASDLDFLNDPANTVITALYAKDETLNDGAGGTYVLSWFGVVVVDALGVLWECRASTFFELGDPQLCGPCWRQSSRPWPFAYWGWLGDNGDGTWVNAPVSANLDAFADLRALGLYDSDGLLVDAFAAAHP